MNSDRKFEFKMAKVLKKAQCRNDKEDRFYPSCVNLHKWCERDGVLEFYSLIRRRILTELENDEDDGIIGDHIFFKSDLYKLYLDSDGIFLVSHILNGYFGEDCVREMWLFVRRDNKYREFVFQFRQAVKKSETKLLEQCLSQLLKETKNGEDLDVLSDILREELNNRKYRKLIPAGRKKV